MRRSITRRLALLFAAVNGAAFLALGLFLAHSVEVHFEELDREALAAAVDRVAREARAVRTSADLEAFGERIEAQRVEHDPVAVWVVRAAGDPLVWDRELPYPRRDDVASPPARSAPGGLFLWEEEGRLYRGMAARVPVGVAGEPPLQVWAGLDIGHHTPFLQTFERAQWLAIAAAVLLAAALGTAAARTGMAPVRALVRHTHRISTSRLDQRLDTRELPEELLDLGEAFNDMLERLHGSFQRLSEFSSDIAHELRTPVCNLLTETQVMLSRGRSTGEYQEVLASNAEELERLSRMVSDMLFLAKADNGQVIPSRERVDLAAEVRELFEFYDALADEKGLLLGLDGEAAANGDRLMLRRVINNLLSNAIRYTPAGGRIAVTLRQGPATAAVTVVNTGEPIPAEVLPRLFERFYRVDPSRQRSSEGAGLGLAIAQSIVQAHGGEMRVWREPAGNAFGFWLPAVRPAPTAVDVGIADSRQS